MPKSSVCANACTDCTSPLRVIIVPKRQSENVSPIRTRFQTRSMSRFSWIMTECRYAVAASQGMSDAFSTGSHAQ